LSKLAFALVADRLHARILDRRRGLLGRQEFDELLGLFDNRFHCSGFSLWKRDILEGNPKKYEKKRNVTSITTLKQTCL
jgi:hypothetical protein